MESRDPAGYARANAAIEDVAAVRARLADRVDAPWWYRWAIALSVSVMFLGMGLIVGGPGSYSNESLGIMLIAVAACLAPTLLLAALNNATGVSMDRYSEGLGWWWLVLFGLLAVSFALQAVAEVPMALAAGGIAALVVTVSMEAHIDKLLRRRLSDAQQAA